MHNYCIPSLTKEKNRKLEELLKESKNELHNNSDYIREKYDREINNLKNEHEATYNQLMKNIQQCEDRICDLIPQKHYATKMRQPVINSKNEIQLEINKLMKLENINVSPIMKLKRSVIAVLAFNRLRTLGKQTGTIKDNVYNYKSKIRSNDIRTSDLFIKIMQGLGENQPNNYVQAIRIIQNSINDVSAKIVQRDKEIEKLSINNV